MNTPAPAPLLTAPTFDMAQPLDSIGLTRAFTPARRLEDVRYWRPILSVEPLPADRFRVHVQGNAAVFPMTTGRTVPVVLARPAHRRAYDAEHAERMAIQADDENARDGYRD